jgi:transporter family-2 protein
MNLWIGMLGAIGAGMLLTFQPLMNAILARAVGSPFGATLVSLIVSLTGALLFFVCIIGGQLVGAILADHLGLFGLAVRHVTAERLIGVALVLGGALLVQRG